MEKYEAPKAEVMDFAKDYVWCAGPSSNSDRQHSGTGAQSLDGDTF